MNQLSSPGSRTEIARKISNEDIVPRKISDDGNGIIVTPDRILRESLETQGKLGTPGSGGSNRKSSGGTEEGVKVSSQRKTPNRRSSTENGRWV